MKTNNIFLSIIIPLYNEQNRIDKLAKIYHFLNQQDFSYEVILINDGSYDNTLKMLKHLSKKVKFNLISYETNMGKGFAVKSGMLAAYGRYRLFTDVDLSTPIEELSKFFPYLREYDLVIGSRKMRGANLKKRQSLIRENLGKGFTQLSKLVLELDISDFTCGFKCFSKKASKQIFSRQKIDRWGFDSEILFIAKKLGFSIKEIPISWSNDPQTRVRFPQDIIQSFSDLWRIRYHHFRKQYG